MQDVVIKATQIQAWEDRLNEIEDTIRKLNAERDILIARVVFVRQFQPNVDATTKASETPLQPFPTQVRPRESIIHMLSIAKHPMSPAELRSEGNKRGTDWGKNGANLYITLKRLADKGEIVREGDSYRLP